MTTSDNDIKFWLALQQSYAVNGSYIVPPELLGEAKRVLSSPPPFELINRFLGKGKEE